MGFLGDLIGGVSSFLGDIGSSIFPGSSWISTGLDALGSGLSGAMQGQNNREMMEWQSNENRLSREFNAQQAQLDRDFQHQMWNLQNEYNNPINQVRRLQSAGLNPLKAIGQGGSSGISNSLPSGANASSSPSSPSFPYSPVQASMQAMSTHGAYLKSLTSAMKDISGSQLDQETINQVRQQIKNLVSEQRFTELKSRGQELSNEIVNLTGKRQAEAQIALLIAQKDNEVVKKLLNEEMTANEKEKWFTYYWQGFETKMRALLGEKEYQKAEIALAYEESRQIEEIRNMRADTRYKNTAADQNEFVTKYLMHDQHAENVYNRLVRGYDSNGRPIDKTLFIRQQDAIIADCDERINSSDLPLEKKKALRQEVRKAVKANDWYEFNQAINAASTISGSASSLIFAKSALKRQGDLGRMISNQIEQSNKVRYHINYDENGDMRGYSEDYTR